MLNDAQAATSGIYRGQAGRYEEHCMKFRSATGGEPVNVATTAADIGRRWFSLDQGESVVEIRNHRPFSLTKTAPDLELQQETLNFYIGSRC